MHREDFTVATLHNLYNYVNVIDFSIQRNPKNYSLGHKTIRNLHGNITSGLLHSCSKANCSIDIDVCTVCNTSDVNSPLPWTFLQRRLQARQNPGQACGAPIF